MRAGPPIRRREFMGVLGGAAAWPFSAHTQQPLPVIGFLSSLPASHSQHLVSGFRRGLQETGFTEGGNVAIEYRWADAVYDRLQALSAELVERGVAVLVSTGGQPTVRAAKTTRTIIPPGILAIADEVIE